MKNLPFTTEQFFEVFRNYNTSVFPAQIIIIILGIIAIGLLHSKNKLKNSFIGFFLGIIWLWTGMVYHLLFFSEINKAAYGFAGLFILQGIFIVIATVKSKLEFEWSINWASYLGYFFVLFGLIIYPLLSYSLESSLEQTITFGLPCPTTIITFGLLMLSKRKMNKYLVIIPSIWAVIGTGAAINFGVYPDYVMILAALVADVYLLKRKKTTVD